MWIKGGQEQTLARSGTLPFFVFLVYIFVYMATKRTYQPKKRKRAKTHGFLSRSKTPAGRATIARRRQKGRARLAV